MTEVVEMGRDSLLTAVFSVQKESGSSAQTVKDGDVRDWRKEEKL